MNEDGARKRALTPARASPAARPRGDSIAEVAARPKRCAGRVRQLVPPLVTALLAGSAAAYVPGGGPKHDGAGQAAAAGQGAERDFDSALGALSQRQHDLEAELAAIGPELDITQRRLVARGRAYYRLVRAGLLPVGGGFDALVDHATHVERLRAALTRDLAATRSLEARGVEITAELGRTRTDRAPLEVQRAAMDRAKVVIRESDERRAAFERAFGAAGRSGGDPVAIYGASTGPLAPAGRGFAAMRGRLSLPVGGRCTIRNVHRPSSSGPGMELETATESAVRAVFPGRVAYADRYADYGRTIIIEHAGGYYSVYAGLQRTEVLVGENVSERSTLGSVAPVGSTPAVLYFEIRKGADTLDPAPWLGL